MVVIIVNKDKEVVSYDVEIDLLAHCKMTFGTLQKMYETTLDPSLELHEYSIQCYNKLIQSPQSLYLDIIKE